MEQYGINQKTEYSRKRLHAYLQYTPEMNPIEQIWKQIRQMGFGNIIFKSSNAVVDKLCDVPLILLTGDLIKSITCRPWIKTLFN